MRFFSQTIIETVSSASKFLTPEFKPTFPLFWISVNPDLIPPEEQKRDVPRMVVIVNPITYTPSPIIDYMHGFRSRFIPKD